MDIYKRKRHSNVFSFYIYPRHFLKKGIQSQHLNTHLYTYTYKSIECEIQALTGCFKNDDTKTKNFNDLHKTSLKYISI